MQQFTQEELEALLNLVKYASKDIGLTDEPLIDHLWEKLETLIEKK